MTNTPQLECRITIVHRMDKRIELGMFDPLTCRHEPLGIHGPDQREIDRAVEGLKASIERAGHLLTFCERSEW